MVDEHNFEDRELFYRFRQDGKFIKIIIVVSSGSIFLVSLAIVALDFKTRKKCDIYIL